MKNRLQASQTKAPHLIRAVVSTLQTLQLIFTGEKVFVTFIAKEKKKREKI